MTTKNSKTSKGWNIALWVAQLGLAAMFLMAGFMKTFVPLEQLSQSMSLAAEMPWLIRFIGISELAGGIGLLLPAALRIVPKLTIIAAYALAFVMLLAVLFHLERGEYNGLVIPFVLGLLGVFIGWGRTNKSRIFARTETAGTF